MFHPPRVRRSSGACIPLQCRGQCRCNRRSRSPGRRSSIPLRKSPVRTVPSIAASTISDEISRPKSPVTRHERGFLVAYRHFENVAKGGCGSLDKSKYLSPVTGHLQGYGRGTGGLSDASLAADHDKLHSAISDLCESHEFINRLALHEISAARNPVCPALHRGKSGTQGAPSGTSPHVPPDNIP